MQLIVTLIEQDESLATALKELEETKAMIEKERSHHAQLMKEIGSVEQLRMNLFMVRDQVMTTQISLEKVASTVCASDRSCVCARRQRQRIDEVSVDDSRSGNDADGAAKSSVYCLCLCVHVCVRVQACVYTCVCTHAASKK